MIHEWRSYRLKPGATGEYLALLAETGLPLVTRHLPLMGYWLAETGPLNTLHHLWSYAGWDEREAARASLAEEEGWTRGFVPRAFPLVAAQDNRFLTLQRGSVAFDAALATRRNRHDARAPGTPLLAPLCAGIVQGAPDTAIIAQWQALSGAPGLLALLPRSTDPVPPDPFATGSHSVLRPLAFSPL